MSIPSKYIQVVVLTALFSNAALAVKFVKPSEIKKNSRGVKNFKTKSKPEIYSATVNDGTTQHMTAHTSLSEDDEMLTNSEAETNHSPHETTAPQNDSIFSNSENVILDDQTSNNDLVLLSEQLKSNFMTEKNNDENNANGQSIIASKSENEATKKQCVSADSNEKKPNLADEIPANHKREILERIRLTGEIAQKYSVAVDYRAITLGALKKLAADLNHKKSKN